MQYIDYPSPNFNERRRALKYIMIHYTDMPTLQAALDTLTNPVKEVSAHYCIARDGRIFRLVADDKRAWHAGKGEWQGETDMNSASIGIELENRGHSHGYEEFTTIQIDALISLLKHLVAQHGLDSRDIVGHSDYAPGRKQDPGHLFPWDKLAAEGLGPQTTP